MTDAKTWLSKKKNEDELPLHTHADTASVSSFQLPLGGRRFCSTTRHSVHSYQDWIHDKQWQEAKGICQDSAPPREIIKS